MITDDFKSSWDFTKSTSTYHFDPTRLDRFEDVIAHLGHVEPTWRADIDNIVANSKPATWETRGYKGEGVLPPREDLVAEEYDLERVGADPKMIITHLNWNMPESLKKVSAQFGLADCMERIHVQRPGEVWNLHMDKLQKWNPEDPSRVMRIFIQLTDWQPGQFWEYGNHHWNQWRAGDVSTFDWANMPHSTANAGHHPRVTLQLTGVITDRTQEFLAHLPR
jgi:hypothetical protein